MRNSLYNDDFEDYLETEVKQHRIYPSDHIWRNIQTTLHGEKSWPALTIISIIIIAALTAGTILIRPSTTSLTAGYHPAIPVTKIIADKESASASEAMEKHLSADNITQQTIVTVSEKLGIEPSGLNISLAGISASMPPGDIISLQTAVTNISSSNDVKISYPPSSDKMLKETNTMHTETYEEPLNEIGIIQNVTSFNNIYAFAQPAMKINFADASAKNIISPQNSNPSEIWRDFPITNKPAIIAKSPKFTFQVYAAPSASYRRIILENNGQPGVTASSVNNSNLNKIIRSTPALGMELGFAFGYSLNKKISLTSGLQFNMQQYNIDAYMYKNELLTVPQINNSSSNFDAANFAEAAQSASYPFGISPVTLANRYYEISLPVGLDWQVVNAGRLSLNVGGSVQPTYTFGSNSFVVSSDFSNYNNGASLLRKVNINTSLEAYISYKLGDYTWQIGPQFRYQQLPSFQNSYPVRENLMDYGIKLGFTKSIK